VARAIGVCSWFKFHNIGFHADLNQTYAVGEIDEESQKLIRTTREALDAAIAMCKPGALFRDIGKIMLVLHALRFHSNQRSFLLQ
jgi:methionine aminopeptidase